MLRIGGKCAIYGVNVVIYGVKLLGGRIVFSNHGCLCCCVGPIIDAQMKCKVFYKEKFMIIQIRPVLLLVRDVFFASVYDALLLIRPSCNFRDGRVIQNYTANQAQYFIELLMQVDLYIELEMLSQL